jgi:TorA maturation chaperone TorD
LDDPLDLATETMYRFLGAAVSDPRAAKWTLLADSSNQALAVASADLLRDEFAQSDEPLGFGELPADRLDLRSMINELSPPVDRLHEEYLRVFGLVTCRECPPYETEFQPVEEPFFRSQQMADVAGFYRAFGLEPTGKSRERPDHLALELEFAAYLLMRKRTAVREAADIAMAAEYAAVCQAARATFLREHLCWWTPSFALALRRKAERGFYAALGTVLGALLPIERQRLQVPPPRIPLEASLIESPEACEGCGMR